jgi:S1-C subfamily serine protease
MTAAYPNLKQLSDERAGLIQSIAPRVGAVVLGRRRMVSGIRWRNDLMISAAEALSGAERVEIRVANSNATAEVLATDLGTDVAVLRVPNLNLPPSVGGFPSNPLRVGDTVAIVGGADNGVAAVWGGVRFAGPAWTSRRGATIERRLEIDARFDPTFEGAAIVDVNGAIAAMAVSGPFRRVLGIPAETIEKVVAVVEKHGHLPQPYIGVRLQSLWLDEATRSHLGRSARRIAAVSGVDAGSPAAAAHIELGDLLLTVNGAPAESLMLARQIASLTPGQEIELEVLRGGQPHRVRVQVGERPHG